MTSLDHMLRKSKFSLHNGRHPHMVSGTVASTNWIPWIPKRIQHAMIVIPQALDNDSLFLNSSGRWIPPEFPGESACR
jgi:hypothetical protein